MKFKTILYVPILCIAITLRLYPAALAVKATVKEYNIITVGLYTEDNKLARIALRKFCLNGRQYYLALNPITLDTELVPIGRYLIAKNSLGDLRNKYGNLPYFKAIILAESNSRRMRNAGIIHMPGGGPDIFITADLCPTKLFLDRTLFTRLISDFGSVHKPIPIALAASGVWMDKHPNDLQWLKNLILRKELIITWINHTYSHKYYKRIPWWKNFLLDKRVRLNNEIIQNEITMIESGLVPSIFFRFPGLISNKELFRQVTEYGLIPIGSDAWLGKKQWPVNGSIILVHANGQEPVGIKRLLWLLGNKKEDIAAGRWVFSDIRNGLSRAMKMN
jgi:hypothetical protein